MSSSSRNPLDAIDDGLTAAARAIGRAVGLLRHLDPRGRKRSSSPPPRKRAAPPRRTDERSAPRPPAAGEEEALKAEIARIEGEIDRVYGAIVAGAGAERQSGGTTAASDLNDLIMRARTLKEQLGERRLDLARLERAAARERRLQPRLTAQLETTPLAEEPASVTPNGRARTTAQPAPAKPLLAAVERALKELKSEGVFADPAQQLSFERLARNLADADAEIRRVAATQLGDIDTPASVRVLSLAVDDASDKVRVAALNALARMGSSSANGVFRRHVGHSNHHLRLASLRGLAKTSDPEAERHLIEALEDGQALVRKTAATLLGWREMRQAVRPLMSALHDEDEHVRVAAATSLGSLRDDRAGLALIRALLDESLAVREAALGSLRTITGQAVDVDPLDIDENQVAALKVWWRTARVDARFGKSPELAVPQLAVERHRERRRERAEQPEEQPVAPPSRARIPRATATPHASAVEPEPVKAPVREHVAAVEPEPVKAPVREHVAAVEPEPVKAPVQERAAVEPEPAKPAIDELPFFGAEQAEAEPEQPVAIDELPFFGAEQAEAEPEQPVAAEELPFFEPEAQHAAVAEEQSLLADLSPDLGGAEAVGFESLLGEDAKEEVPGDLDSLLDASFTGGGEASDEGEAGEEGSKEEYESLLDSDLLGGRTTTGG